MVDNSVQDLNDGWWKKFVPWPVRRAAERAFGALFAPL